MEHMFSQFVILPDSASPCFLVSLKIFFVSTSILWVKGWKRTCIPSGVCFLGKLSTLTIFSTYCTIHCICINLPTENVGWGYLAMWKLCDMVEKLKATIQIWDCPWMALTYWLNLATSLSNSLSTCKRNQEVNKSVNYI